MIEDTALCEVCDGEASLHDRIVERGYPPASIEAETIGGLTTYDYPADIFWQWRDDPVQRAKLLSTDYLDFGCSFVLGPGNLTYYTCDYARVLATPVPGTLTVTPTRTPTVMRTPTRTATATVAPSVTLAP
jgi:hypothetical protein